MSASHRIIGGVVAGLLIAGVAAPAIVAIAPSQFRGAPLLLIAAATIVTLTTCAAWLVFGGPPRD